MRGDFHSLQDQPWSRLKNPVLDNILNQTLVTLFPLGCLAIPYPRINMFMQYITLTLSGVGGVGVMGFIAPVMDCVGWYNGTGCVGNDSHQG